MNRRRLVLLLVLLLVPALASTGLGHAASLSLSPATLAGFTAGHPCDGQAQARSTSAAPTNRVEVTVPAACAGRTLRVAVTTNGVTVQGSGTVPTGGGPVEVTLSGSFTPSATTRVDATVDGWHLPVAWTPPVQLPAVSCRVVNHPAATCSVRIDRFTTWGHPVTTHFQMDATVIGEHNANGQEWELTFDFSHGTYPFVPRGVQSNGGLVLQSACTSMPVMTVRGNPGWAGPYHQIRAGQTRSVYLQGYATAGGNLLTCP